MVTRQHVCVCGRQVELTSTTKHQAAAPLRHIHKIGVDTQVVQQLAPAGGLLIKDVRHRLHQHAAAAHLHAKQRGGGLGGARLWRRSSESSHPKLQAAQSYCSSAPLRLIDACRAALKPRNNVPCKRPGYSRSSAAQLPTSQHSCALRVRASPAAAAPPCESPSLPGTAASWPRR